MYGVVAILGNLTLKSTRLLPPAGAGCRVELREGSYTLPRLDSQISVFL